MSGQSPHVNQGKGLCLLSLDAGGPQNISQLKILAELMHRLNYDVAEDQKHLPCEVFDMIGGSGSGGFIAILLVTLGVTAEQALDEFIDFSVNILEKPGVDANARTKELSLHIDKLLEKYSMEKRKRLTDPNVLSKGCKLAIPIFHKEHIKHPRMLRNFKDDELSFTIADAILTTLASPPLFTPTTISNEVTTSEYISGDLKLSNPTRTIVSEACDAFGEDSRVACLLSIGSGQPGVLSMPDGSDLATWNRFLENSIKDSEHKAEEIEAQMGHLGLYYRFSVSRGLEREKDGPGLYAGNTITHTVAYLAGVSVSRKVAGCADVLKLRDGVASLGQLTRSGGQSVAQPTLPALTRTFVMRKGPWEFIENAVFGVDDIGDIQGPRMLAVTGMGGSGKTQLILKFLRVHRDKFELCLFVDASSVPNIRAGIMQNVRSLDIAHSQKAFEECLLFLSRPSLVGQRVIVYDNVDDPDLDLAPLLPSGNSCTIVITSRNRLLGDLCPNSHLELDVMSMDEGIEFLLYPTGSATTMTEEARRDAGAIAETLGCLPIALQQARSYISQTKCSARAYLDRLNESRDVLLAQPARFQLDMAAVSAYAAFETSFKRLSLGSQKYLRLLSYFHWRRFPLELVMLAAKYKFSEYEFTYTGHGQDFHEGKATLDDIFLPGGKWRILHLDKMMVELQNYSLITSTPSFDTVLMEMHPLVHGWVQSCVPAQENPMYQSGAILLLALGARNEYTPSAQYLASHAIHMSPVWDRLHSNSAEAFATVLESGGSFEGALQLREKVVTELRIHAEPNSMEVVHSIWGLALIYHRLGRHRDAEPLQRESLMLMTEVLGERHPDTIAASDNLAITYRKLGRLKEAEVLQEEVLKASKEILGERHPDTITASNNLALTYWALGRLKEAEVLLEEVLKARKEILGERHPDTIAASNNLALTYCELGRLKEAEVLQEEVLKARKEILGERHPDTITTSSNLAITYGKLGRLKEAEALQEEVVKASKEVLGDRHPDTITASSNLAITYCGLGRLKEAEALQEAVWKARKEVLGERHPDTITTSSKLAITYGKLGRLKEAGALEEEVVRASKEVLGDRHPDVITASNNLAITYCKLGRLKEAELLQEEVVKLMKEILGERHPDTIITSNNLALTYRNLGRLKEAEALQERTLRAASEVLGRGHPTTLILMLTMAEVYEALEHKEDALKLLDEAEPIVAEKLGRDHGQFKRCQKVRIRVGAVNNSPTPAMASTPGTESATMPAIPSSHNLAPPSRRSGVRRLIGRVRDRLS